MWLIVTGPDKSGKTTLCRALSDIYQVPVRKCTYAIDHRNLRQITAEHLCLYETEKTLWDRWHYPEDIIYGAVVEHRPSVLAFHQHAIESMLHKVGAVFLYLHVNREVLVERYEQSGDEYLTVEQLLLVYDWYREFMHRTSLRVININATFLDTAEVADKVQQKLRRMNW